MKRVIDMSKNEIKNWNEWNEEHWEKPWKKREDKISKWNTELEDLRQNGEDDFVKMVGDLLYSKFGDDNFDSRIFFTRVTFLLLINLHREVLRNILKTNDSIH